MKLMMKKNPAQPKRRRVLRSVLAATIVVGISGAAACEETTQTDRGKALSELNYDRTVRGLPALRLNETLNQKATAWAQTLRDRCALSHSRLSDGVSALNWRKLGENVGYGPSIEVVQDAFMNSPSHRSAILDGAYEIVGLGVVWGTCNGSRRVFVVQEFADLF